MNSKKIYILALIVIIVGLAFFYYQKDEKISLPELINNVIKNNEENKEVKNDAFLLEDGKVQLKISEQGFNPDKFRVKRNVLLSISLINEEKDTVNNLMFENKALSLFLIAAPNSSTQEITIVTPDKPGEYTFFTNIGERRDGVMIVEE